MAKRPTQSWLGRFFSGNKSNTTSSTKNYAPFTNIFGDGRFGRGGVLSPAQALEYYTHIAPLYSAVDMIASKAAAVELAIDNGSDEIGFNHPLLTILSKPNAFMSKTEFFEHLYSFYLLTGNAYVVATGPVNRPPLELEVVNPGCVTVIRGDDGYPASIQVLATAGKSRTFMRKETPTGGRFFSQGADAEIWHIKAFNPRSLNGDLLGMSPIAPIMDELDQYVEASLHNLSLLKRGSRPSGAFKFNRALSDDEFQRLQQSADRFYSGGSNAGRVMILEEGEFQEMSQTNKDMDFATLKKEVTQTIYSAYRIPIPLVNAEFSTYDNLKTSTLNLYDNAVLPVVTKVLVELQTMLMERYERKNIVSTLVYDPESIPALEPRAVDKVQKMRETGILTTNELRSILGYDPVEGGDTILVDANQVPLGDGGLDLVNSMSEVDPLPENM